MALTDAQLAAAIRVGTDFDALEPALQGVLSRLNRMSRATVQSHTANAPEDVEDEAVIRLAGYLYDAPTVTRFGQAFRESGALALVDPWKVRGAAVVDTGTAGEVFVPVGMVVEVRYQVRNEGGNGYDVAVQGDAILSEDGRHVLPAITPGPFTGTTALWFELTLGWAVHSLIRVVNPLPGLTVVALDDLTESLQPNGARRYSFDKATAAIVNDVESFQIVAVAT